MESQPQNPEFRINPKTFHPCFSIALLFCIFFTFEVEGVLV